MFFSVPQFINYRLFCRSWHTVVTEIVDVSANIAAIWIQYKVLAIINAMNWERITYMITTKYTFVREGISSISTHHRPVSFVSSIPNLLKQKVSSMSCEWCSLSGIWWSNKASILRCCSFQYLLRTRKQSLLGCW